MSFRSPNAGPQRMRVTEIDKVLSSYIKHSKPNDNDSDSFVITASEVLAESLSVDQGVQDEIKEFIKVPFLFDLSINHFWLFCCFIIVSLSCYYQTFRKKSPFQIIGVPPLK